MEPTPGEYLHVPGATLYYAVQGKGPLLLLIAAGSGSADRFANLIPRLTDSFTVISYDRRGVGGSTLVDPDQDVTMRDHADDAHWLLAALTNKPAYVFGSSVGALIALDLTTRYPEQVRRLVAHEPPAAYLLPDAQKVLDGLDVRSGDVNAFSRFAQQIGKVAEDLEPGVTALQPSPATAEAYARAFFRYTAPAAQRYRLDFDTLRGLNSRIVIGGGLTGRDYIGYASGVAVAENLALTVTDFPGNHLGYICQPTAFAQTLRSTLSAKA